MTHPFHLIGTCCAESEITPDIRERFGFAVKSRHEALDMTREDLAGRAGIDRTYLSDVERGSRNLGLLNIERLAVALSISLADLFHLAKAR